MKKLKNFYRENFRFANKKVYLGIGIFNIMIGLFLLFTLSSTVFGMVGETILATLNLVFGANNVLIWHWKRKGEIA